MKKLIAILLLSSCSNDAIIFARSIDSSAQCTAIHTSLSGNDNDIASCRVGMEVWLCTVSHTSLSPECIKIRDIPLEKK